jgi:hypothetical protein
MTALETTVHATIDTLIEALLAGLERHHRATAHLSSDSEFLAKGAMEYPNPGQRLESGTFSSGSFRTLSLPETVPVLSDGAYLIREASTQDTADTTHGAAVSGTETTVSAEPTLLGPFEHLVRLHSRILDDYGLGRAALRRVLVDEYRSALADALIAGDGQSGIPLGVIRTTGIQTQDATELPVSEALAEASAKIGEVGFVGRLYAAVAHPRTLATVIFGADTRNVHLSVPLIARYIPSLAVDPGDVVVGEWFSGSTLFDGGLDVAASLEDRDELSFGGPRVVAEGRISYWVREPRAFVHVTNLSS